MTARAGTIPNVSSNNMSLGMFVKLEFTLKGIRWVFLWDWHSSIMSAYLSSAFKMQFSVASWTVELANSVTINYQNLTHLSCDWLTFRCNSYSLLKSRKWVSCGDAYHLQRASSPSYFCFSLLKRVTPILIWILLGASRGWNRLYVWNMPYTYKNQNECLHPPLKVGSMGRSGLLHYILSVCLFFCTSQNCKLGWIEGVSITIPFVG